MSVLSFSKNILFVSLDFSKPCITFRYTAFFAVLLFTACLGTGGGVDHPFTGSMTGFDGSGLQLFIALGAALDLYALFRTGGILLDFPVTGSMLTGGRELLGFQRLAAFCTLAFCTTLVYAGGRCDGFPITFCMGLGDGDDTGFLCFAASDTGALFLTFLTAGSIGDDLPAVFAVFMFLCGIQPAICPTPSTLAYS